MRTPAADLALPHDTLQPTSGPEASGRVAQVLKAHAAAAGVRLVSPRIS